MAIREQPKHLYVFGAFRLEPQQRLLTCSGKPVPLQPKAFEVLLMLVQNAGRLVDKDDLMKQLWPETFVEEGNLTKHISLLRKVLGEAENGQEYIAAVPKRGYRFVGRVTEVTGNSPKPGEGGAEIAAGVPFAAGDERQVPENAGELHLSPSPPAPLPKRARREKLSRPSREPSTTTLAKRQDRKRKSVQDCRHRRR